MPNVLSPMDLVPRPDNIDETVLSSTSFNLENKKAIKLISDTMPLKRNLPPSYFMPEMVSRSPKL